MKVAMVIVAIFFIVSICDQLLTGFLHNYSMTKVFNIVPVIIQSILLFVTWVVGNWALCTLFNGEGTMRNICVNTAYALVPYIIGRIINIILSNCLTRDEATFLTFVNIITIGYSALLLISGMKTVHQYNFWQTIVSMLFTIVAMVIIIILAVLLVSLFQQVYLFVYAIYTELLYRNPSLSSAALILIMVGVIVAVIAVVCVAYTLYEKAQIKKEQKKLR